MFTKKSKQRTGTRTRHDIEVLSAAINDIKMNKMSIRQASKFHKIPLTTLHDKLHGKIPLVAKLLLTKGEEKSLVKWLIELSQQGFGKTIDEVRETAQAIIAARNNNQESKIALPSTQWVKGLFNRNKEHGSQCCFPKTGH